MIQSFIYTSENDNFYLYDDKHWLSMLVHPEFEKASIGSTDADEYYLKKYMYLKNNGFFSTTKLVDFRVLDESIIRNNIINTKQVVFEATDSCNLSCKYCSFGELYEGFEDRTIRKINTRNAINLLKYIFKLKPKNKNSKLYISFYGGEALLNMNFIKRIVEIANQLNAEKGIEIEYSMTTNATLINKYIDFLVANKFQLLISLDGNEENHSYRVFRKNNTNSFQQVIQNLDMIQTNYPEYFFTYVSFNAVLHNRNSIKEIYKFIYTRYHKIPRIAELNMIDIRKDKKEQLKSMYKSKRESETEFLMEESELSHITHDNSMTYKELIEFLKYLSINYYISNVKTLLSIEEKYLPTSTCTPFSKKIFLTNRNKLLPCEKVNYKYSLGKVDNNVEIDIQKITRQYNYYFENLKKFCQNCYAYRFCGVCLFRINNIDNVYSEEFFCDKFYDQKAYKKKLQRIFSFLEKYPVDFSKILEKVIIH